MILIFTVGIFSVSLGQARQTFVDAVNQAWTNNDNNSLSQIIDQKLQSDPNDLAALYVAKTFYVLIMPNRAKALAAATALKQLADQTQNTNLKELAAQSLKEVQDIPASEFQPMTIPR